MEELVYRAIRNKIERSNNKETIVKTMSEYEKDYLQQFTLYKLENINLEKPDIDDLIMYLIYQNESLKQFHENELKRIHDDLYNKHLDGIITGLDIKDVIYNK